MSIGGKFDRIPFEINNRSRRKAAFDDRLQRGGLRVVDTLRAKYAIPHDMRKIGMEVRVVETANKWRLIGEPHPVHVDTDASHWELLGDAPAVPCIRNYIFIDSVEGDDVLALTTPCVPFRTPEAGIAFADVGDLVTFCAGEYRSNDTINWYKPGVAYHLEADAIIYTNRVSHTNGLFGTFVLHDTYELHITGEGKVIAEVDDPFGYFIHATGGPTGNINIDLNLLDKSRIYIPSPDVVNININTMVNANWYTLYIEDANLANVNINNNIIELGANGYTNTLIKGLTVKANISKLNIANTTIINIPGAPNSVALVNIATVDGFGINSQTSTNINNANLTDLGIIIPCVAAESVNIDNVDIDVNNITYPVDTANDYCIISNMHIYNIPSILLNGNAKLINVAPDAPFLEIGAGVVLNLTVGTFKLLSEEVVKLGNGGFITNLDIIGGFDINIEHDITDYDFNNQNKANDIYNGDITFNVNSATGSDLATGFNTDIDFETLKGAIRRFPKVINGIGYITLNQNVTAIEFKEAMLLASEIECDHIEITGAVTVEADINVTGTGDYYPNIKGRHTINLGGTVNTGDILGGYVVVHTSDAFHFDIPSELQALGISGDVSRESRLVNISITSQDDFCLNSGHTKVIFNKIHFDKLPESNSSRKGNIEFTNCSFDADAIEYEQGAADVRFNKCAIFADGSSANDKLLHKGTNQINRLICNETGIIHLTPASREAVESIDFTNGYINGYFDIVSVNNDDIANIENTVVINEAGTLILYRILNPNANIKTNVTVYAYSLILRVLTYNGAQTKNTILDLQVYNGSEMKAVLIGLAGGYQDAGKLDVIRVNINSGDDSADADGLINKVSYHSVTEVVNTFHVTSTVKKVVGRSIGLYGKHYTLDVALTDGTRGVYQFYAGQGALGVRPVTVIFEEAAFGIVVTASTVLYETIPYIIIEITTTTTAPFPLYGNLSGITKYAIGES